MPDNASENLAWLSRLMAWLSTIGAVVSPLIVVAVYLWPGFAQPMMVDIDHTGSLLNPNVPLPYRLAALVFSLGAEAFNVWALWSLRTLFFLYARGEVFSPRALRLLNNVAVALFAGVIVGFVVHAPITLLLTWALGHGRQEISLEFGSPEVVTLFSAGVVLIISRVMVKAGQAAEENAKFV
jgi:hypothetical protein